MYEGFVFANEYEARLSGGELCTRRTVNLQCDEGQRRRIGIAGNLEYRIFPEGKPYRVILQDGYEVNTRIGELAKKYKVNIVAGSVSNVRGGKVYNTAFVFDRAGSCIAEYDKTHLFTPMGEDDYYTCGDHLCRFTLDGVKCGIIICYDVRFPELTRSLALQGLDMLFVVSQWPKERIFHLQTLTVARAIENQMFVVCCNSCGTAGKTVYGGHSAIIEPFGKTLVLAGRK